MSKKHITYLFYLLLILFLQNEQAIAKGTNFKREYDISSEKREKLEKELNNLYKKVLLKEMEHRRKDLVMSQKEWEKYRDIHCEYESKAYYGGTLAPAEWSQCSYQLIKERIEKLKYSLEILESR